MTTETWTPVTPAVDELWSTLPLLTSRIRFPGVNGSFARTPDAPENSITGNMDLRIKLSADDWTPAQSVLMAKDAGGSNTWSLELRATGTLEFNSSSATTSSVRRSDVAVPFVDGSVHWLRVASSVPTTGAASFFTSEDGFVWTQLGSVISGSALTISDPTSAFTIGTRNNGVGVTAKPFKGNVYYAEMRNGIDGPVVASFNANDALLGATSFVSSQTGETWTLLGTATLLNTQWVEVVA